jgi:hypothetical protein
LHELKKDPALAGILYFKVFTVDSYQGEENDVIMLSLVRSNNVMSIGFLESRNRLVVALSRARRGLYIYGNSTTLVSGEQSENFVGRDPLWGPLIFHMRDHGWYDMDRGLPTYCAKHDEWVHVKEPDDWVGMNGGCWRRCGGVLDCGHPCVYGCHPFDHSTVSCNKPCPLMLPCGHACSRKCSAHCQCSEADCVYSGVLKLEEATFAQAASRCGNNLDIRTEKEIGYGASIRQYDPSPHSKGGHSWGPWVADNLGFGKDKAERPIATLSSSERVRAWNTWDGKKFDVASAKKLAASARNEPHPPQKLVFKEDFKSITIEGGKRRENVGGASKRIVDHEITTEQIQNNKVQLTDSKSAEHLIELTVDVQLPTNQTANPTANGAQLKEEFDLLSFDEPVNTVPKHIQGFDFDLFEAQFG